MHTALTRRPAFHMLAGAMNQLEQLTIGQLKRAIEIRESIEALQKELVQILGGETPTPQAPEPELPTAKGRKKFSPATRAAMAKAQKARWAKIWRGDGPASNTEKPKRKMSEAGRAAIAAGAKLRWAKAKAAGKNGL